MKRIACAIGLLGLTSSTAAVAATTPAHDGPYAQALFNAEFPDSGRDSQTGYGFQIGGGIPLTRYGMPDTSLELNLFRTERARHIDGNNDYQTAVMADWVYDFGLFGWGADSVLPNFKPYVLGGLGVVFDDVRGNSTTHPALDAGVGVLIPLHFMGWAVRTEARVIGQQNHTSVPSQDFLFDWHVGIGLQIPLDFIFGGTPAPAAAPPPVKVVPVTVTPAAPPPPGDADSDGVPDPQDHCPDSPTGEKVDAQGCALAQTIIWPEVQFETASALLTDAAKAKLSGFAKSIDEQPALRVAVVGYTDTVGSEKYNQTLSEQRAQSVREVLISKGAPPEQLNAHGEGSSHPLASNATEAGRAQNRRVEFRLTLSPAS